MNFSRRFEMEGQLTLSFAHWPTALVAYELLKAALSAIGDVQSMNMPPPDPNLAPGERFVNKNNKGPFTITITGKS